MGMPIDQHVHVPVVHGSLYFKITVILASQFKLQCTSFDPSMTFNIVSNVFRIPMAVTAFSSLSSPSNSCTKVPACENRLLQISFVQRPEEHNIELYYNGNCTMGIFWDIFHRLCQGFSHTHVNFSHTAGSHVKLTAAS